MRHTHTHSTVRAGSLFLCSCISSVREKASSAWGGGDGCHGYRFWLSLSLFLCLSLSTPLSVSVCLSLRLLVLSVGVGIQGSVYELNPVALRCRESELRGGVGFKCARLFHSDGHSLTQSIYHRSRTVHTPHQTQHRYTFPACLCN